MGIPTYFQITLPGSSSVTPLCQYEAAIDIYNKLTIVGKFVKGAISLSLILWRNYYFAVDMQPGQGMKG